MAAMAKIAAGANEVQWYHDIVKRDEKPVESEQEIIGGSEDGPI